jgi:micrococcal nuclease
MSVFKIFLPVFILFTAFNVSASVGGVFTPSTECFHDEHNLRCVDFVSNYDGDTVTVNVPDVHPLMGKKVSVRLKGVDTPELRSKNPVEKEMAKKVKIFVNEKLKTAKRIDLVDIKRDKYFRINADLIVDGESLSSLLLSRDYAYEYDGGTKKDIDWSKTFRKS